MAFDGVTLYSVLNELKILIGGKVNHIYQPNNNNVIISIYNGNTYALNIDTTASNYRLHLTTHIKSNPFNAPNFCMLLRKYLMSSKIKNIYMNELERICYINFECFNEMNDKVIRTLVVELMGKYSNVLLLNENNNIIDALKKFDISSVFSNYKNNSQDSQESFSNTRDIMPARQYVVPISDKNNFIGTTLDEFCNVIQNSDFKTLDSAIPSLYTGISKMFIQSCLESLKIANTISANNLKEIYNYLKIILLNKNTNLYLNNSTLNSTDQKVVCKDFKNNYTIALLNKPLESNSDNSIIDSLQVNFFIDDYYFRKFEQEEYTNYRNNLMKILSGTLDKLTKKLNNINEKIDSCSELEKNKIYGELLTANIYKFTNKNAYDAFESDISEVELENYYDNNNLVKIPVESSLSIQKNAEKYFKKYNKMKNTLEVTKIQKEQTQKELQYLESLVYELDNCKNLLEIDDVYTEISEDVLFNDINKKNKFGKQCAYLEKNSKKNVGKQSFSSNKKNKENETMLTNYIKLKVDDFDVFIGKNNKQNDYLSMRIANSNDLWFHAKDIHGSHLILRCNGEMPKLSTIVKCAELSAYFSKAKFSSHVPVDYTLAKYVKKPNGSVPGYVIYTNNKTIYVDPSTDTKI